MQIVFVEAFCHTKNSCSKTGAVASTAVLQLFLDLRNSILTDTFNRVSHDRVLAVGVYASLYMAHPHAYKCAKPLRRWASRRLNGSNTNVDAIHLSPVSDTFCHRLTLHFSHLIASTYRSERRRRSPRCGCSRTQARGCWGIRRLHTHFSRFRSFLASAFLNSSASADVCEQVGGRAHRRTLCIVRTFDERTTSAVLAGFET